MIREPINRALLLMRTTRNLRPYQVLHRARLRAQRFPPSRPLASSIISVMRVKPAQQPGWPVAFAPLDAQLAEGLSTPEENARGRFTFLNDARDLGDPPRWDPPGASRLWKYHLHYLEWAWSFASHPDPAWARTAFAGLWRSWASATRFGSGDVWSPYVASLRAWVLCGTYEALAAGAPIQSDVDESLIRHARFLRWHIEHDVGGNHLIKNLKALIGLGVFLDDNRLTKSATRNLERQLAIQVLADGGHYERSPSYHCQVLGDLIDVERLLAAAGRPAVPGLATAIASMRVWLGLMLAPDGDVPLFNDCVLVGPGRLGLLCPGPGAAARLTILEDSGYVVIRPHRDVHLVADVGDPCPPDLPAHAHADCLSFELWLGGRRVVVDSGTSTYEPGPQRAYERSTLAHNTVSIDGADQTEVWGTFRAARLAGATLKRADDDGHTVTVTAAHDGYRRFRGQPVHRRTWRASAAELEIVDEISGRGRHTVEARVHFTTPSVGAFEWSSPGGLTETRSNATYATGFGTVHDALLVSATWQGELPVAMRMKLRLPDQSGPDDEAGSVHVETMKGAT